MKYNFMLRFNLGHHPKGTHKQWRMKNYETGEYTHYDPNEVSIVCKNCKLRNYPMTAKKIFDGANKVTCAFVEMESFEIIPKEQAYFVVSEGQAKYNPKVAPNWVLNGENADNKCVTEIITQGRNCIVSDKADPTANVEPKEAA